MFSSLVGAAADSCLSRCGWPEAFLRTVRKENTFNFFLNSINMNAEITIKRKTCQLYHQLISMSINHLI